MIGGAFGKIVDSADKHLFMPLVGVLMPGEQGYVGWKLVVRGREIPYGLFLGELVNFLIVALAVFVFIVKYLGWATKAKQEPVAAPAPPTRDQALLAEIRDLLKRPSGRAEIRARVAG